MDPTLITLIAIFVALTLLFNAWLKPKSSRRYARVPAARARAHFPFEIFGRARVTDADGINVNGREIRLAGLDAPEYGQPAVIHGRTVNHGGIIKHRLIKLIGGNKVRAVITDTDKYHRLIGTVYHGETDINEFMVESGWAVAAYGNQYNRQQAFARKNRKGMWNYDSFHDPRTWKSMDDPPNAPKNYGKRFRPKRSRSGSDSVSRYITRKLVPYRYRRLFRL